MASNGLVANQSKTEFLVLNSKKNDTLNNIKVGNTMVSRTNNTKLLGIVIEDSQEWHLHFKSLKNTLNRRLFVIRRVASQMPKNKIMSIVHSLWVSKLRYGLQLCSRVRTTESDPSPTSMKALQTTQNRLLRTLNNSRIKDKVSTSTMLEKFGLLSVNQLAAQIKLLEVWKATHMKDYPIELEPYYKIRPLNSHNLRTQNDRAFNDSSKLKIAENSFTIFV